MKGKQNAKNGSDNKPMQHKKMARKANNNFSTAKILLAVSAALIPFVLMGVTYALTHLVLNSGGDKCVNIELEPNRVKVSIDQQRTTCPKSEKQ